MEYIALIHKNTDSTPTSEEWTHFFEVASETSMFRGGSQIGKRLALGTKEVADTTFEVGGYMRFESDNLNLLRELLKTHPVVVHGGTIELCELPKS